MVIEKNGSTYSDVENRTKGDESENAATPEASRLAVIEKRMVT